MEDTQVKNNMRGYHGHRGRQRERILRVAETLFLRDGIESVGINDIAAAANVTRATIYRYFANRIELIWALLRWYGESIVNTMPAEVMNPKLSGAVRLQFVLQGFMEHFFRYPEQSLFAIQFDQLYADNKDIEKMAQFKKELVQNEFPLSRLIEAGVRDGSLRPNLDPIVTSTTILAVVWGVSRHFAQLYTTYEYENKYPIREIYQEVCDVMLQGLVVDK
jgi:AcrR family transcriptional regulator